MAVRNVIRMGDARLRETSLPVPENDLGSRELKKLLRDMYDTMEDYDGAGLAAPQIGELRRIFVVGLDHGENRGYEKKAYINPEIEILNSPSEGSWEGCLSVPGMRGYVERSRKIRIKYYNENGDFEDTIVEGYEAVVLQHEFDHLNGILYVDRIKDTRLFGFNEELTQQDAI